MQVSLSLMTQYDDRVFKNVETHRAALRSASLDVLRTVTEPDLSKPEFRIQLAGRLRDRINMELERLEGFGGIEEVFFTEFVYQ
jgi:flagellar FliL protein